MSRCHYVYVGDPNNHDNHHSALTIGRKVYWMLRGMFSEVIYYDWADIRNIPQIDSDDIIIGHPNYHTQTPIRQLFRNNVKYKALIFPLHTKIHTDNWPFNDLVNQADDIFSIQGPYWYDTLPHTMFKNWQPKITRLDMAIDCDLWKYVKTEFNDIGNRGIVYIGNDTANKNLNLLYKIAEAMPNQRFEWYGGYSEHILGRLQNVKIYGQSDIFNMASEICMKNDFIISTSISDANPGTLSEIGLASGLIPLCTPQSGYYENDHFANITLDVNDSINIINKWLHIPSETLKQKSINTRKMCESQFTWDIFLDKIREKLKKYASIS